MPPMDVSGESFQLGSRVRITDKQKEAEQTAERSLPPPPTHGPKLFDGLLGPTRLAVSANGSFLTNYTFMLCYCSEVMAYL